MSERGRIASISAALIVVGLVMGAVLMPRSAMAGHTMPANAGGDCWRAGTPLWCRASWYAAPYHQVRLHFVDNFSSAGYGSQATFVQQACDNWHNYRQPAYNQPDIICNWTSIAADTYVYWQQYTALPVHVYGLTYNCYRNSRDEVYCSASSSQSMSVNYSDVQFSVYNMNQDYVVGTSRTFVMAHETGHALGLAHHQGTDLMTSSSIPGGIAGPTATDYGALPPCSGSYTTYGVRCVFNITN